MQGIFSRKTGLGIFFQFFCIFLVIPFSPQAPAQGLNGTQQVISDSIPGSESSLSNVDSTNNHLLALARLIIEGSTNQERITRNESFKDALKQSLLADSLFLDNFDSVMNVSILYDNSRNFRIATWYVPLLDGTVVFHGFFQTLSLSEQPGTFIELVDQTRQVEGNLQRSLGPENWYGAYYYQLIQLDMDSQSHLVLLGWKGDNPLTRKRVIEPLLIGSGKPIFGSQIFEIGVHNPFRLVFEYSRQVSMSLTFEPSYEKLPAQTVPMIVFDRLMPTHESMEGRYEFYVPEVNVFDGLEFDNGLWKFIPDVDVRVDIEPRLRPLIRP